MLGMLNTLGGGPIGASEPKGEPVTDGMESYAILGWGSLIWDLEILSDNVAGDWQMRAGPRLAMEFSRVSPKRRQALAVCLDSDHGALCTTHTIMSRRGEIGAVIEDLAARERAPRHHIGAVCLVSGHRQGAQATVVAQVADWCARTGRAGAVWTDLPSNFEECLGQGFSVDRAVNYLAGLVGDSRDEAVRYIENAPAETDTPLRRRLAREPWWQREAERLRRR